MKYISFYLPQFHEIPENNLWWGKGFTEWTNTEKALPLFKGHYQPRRPLNDYTYNLTDKKTIQWQIQIAKNYKIDAFCFYHYWFGKGKKLLEKPIEDFLEDKTLDMEFCLSWANENWSRRWDGSENEILVEQNYGNENDWTNHFLYLLNFFNDKRYLKYDNRPVFIIYRPELIPRLGDMVKHFRKLAKDNGLNGLIILSQHPTFYLSHSDLHKYVDYKIEFEPLFSYMRMNKIDRIFNFLNKNVLKNLGFSFFFKYLMLKIFKKNTYQIRDYKHTTLFSSKFRSLDKKSIPGLFVDWDNTARKNKNSVIYHGSNPKIFHNYLTNKVKNSSKYNELGMIFINAWNEWAEGAYLEPDSIRKYDFLQVIRDYRVCNEINVKGR
jgi:hypothetical protein